MKREAESLLVRRLRDKDPSAMDELVEAFGGKIYSLAMGLLQNAEDAADIVQDTLLQVYEKIDTFREEAALSSWIYRIALNFAYMKIRKGKRDNYLPLEEYMPQFQKNGMHLHPVNNWAERADKQVMRKELAKILSENIGKLAEKYRTVLVMRDVQGLSTEEVAGTTGMTVAAVKSRLHRARLFLRERLSQYYEGSDL